MLRSGERGIVALSTLYAGGNYAFGFYFGSLFNGLGFDFHHLGSQPFLILGLWVAAMVLGAAGGKVSLTVAAEMRQRS